MWKGVEVSLVQTERGAGGGDADEKAEERGSPRELRW
jgi:hypothetical protein